jgi:DNA-binding CsgD family transcriptional regulator
MGLTADMSCLTPLEREIVELVGQGFRDWHIDETFWMTRQTLDTHLHSIFGKLGVADQTELARVAARFAPAAEARR